MSGIRVAYTGFITFGIRLLSIITGLVFTLIVTRQLSAEEFGTWGLINGIMVYAVVIHPIVSYWATRETARGEETEKTAIVTTGMLSVIGITAYLLMAYIVGIQSNVDLSILLFAGILVPSIFVSEGLNGVLLGFKPHARSYGFLVFEISKIPVALLLVYHYDMGLEGAIIASLVAYIASIIVLIKYAKERIRGTFTKSYIKKWIKFFWLPLYRKAPSLISMSDVIVFSIVTGSVVGVAYFTAARTIAFIVYHSRAISSGVYPKLLEGGHEQVLRNSLIQFFYVAIPITTISITFAKPGLYALNPIYELAVPVVIFLTFRQLLTSLNVILFNALQGIEKVDLKKDSTFKDYAKSKLILYPTFQLIRHGIYIGSLVIILTILGEENSEIELVTYWALVGFIIEIPLSIYIIRLVNQSFSLNLDWKSLIKYILAAGIIFSIVYFLMDEYLIYYESIFDFLPRVAIFAIGGVASYIGITYLIDHKTKILIKSIVKEFRMKK